MTPSAAPPETVPPPMARGIARIALVAFSSLGDGLLYLMMAHNLALNGYRVTYFGSLAYQLRGWLPDLDIQPHPPLDALDQALSGYDLVLMSPPQPLRDALTAERLADLKSKWQLICLRAPQDWQHDLRATLSARCTPAAYAEIAPLLGGSGAIRYRKFDGESVVDICLDFMRNKMGLTRTQRQVPILPPAEHAFRRHPRRVVLSPDSANAEKKDWSPEGFLRLAHTLEQHGYTPVFVVAPARHQDWQAKIGGRYSLPRFDDIGELAAFIYESGALIANDSGNGHLASFLGVPVVTIYRKNNPRFHWRPDWGPGRVVGPWLTLHWRGKAHWRPFVRTRTILAALEALTCPTKN